MSGRITNYLQETVELRWSEFVRLEKSDEFSALEGVIISLVRAAARGKLNAIQEALDRLDGKVAQGVELEMPKFYYIYPHATEVANEVGGPSQPPAASLTAPVVEKADDGAIEGEPLPTGSLRSVLERMINRPMSEVKHIIGTANHIDETGDVSKGDPYVKSVIIANLLHIALSGKLSVLSTKEILDQIDGKVAEKIKLLGQDMYIKRFDTVAPAGSIKNEDGVYQLEAETVTTFWGDRLKLAKENRRR